MKKAGIVMIAIIMVSALVGCQKTPEANQNTLGENQNKQEPLVDGMEALRVANIVYGVEKTSGEADYDMYGYVVDKLPEDEYYNHYNVKGDNDEIFICNYNGNDELTEGIYVGMWQIGDGWTLEVIDDIKDKSGDGIIFTDENGVKIKNIKVSARGDEPFNFSMTLVNPTNVDQQIDINRIKVENYDGTEISVFSENETAIDIPANTDSKEMTFSISDPGNLKAGDEVSVYYDGAFIYSTVVTE